MRGVCGFYLILIAIYFKDFLCVNCRDFTYKGEWGPEHWGEKYSACGGKHQSPININELNVVPRNYLPLWFKGMSEVPESGEILNNGHTAVVKLTYKNGTTPTVKYGPFFFDYIENVYRFAQLHFHWGENNTIGSEDRINNVSFPAELHMVFYNSIYKDFDAAVKESNGVAVLAFFFKIVEKDNLNYTEFADLLENVQDANKSIQFHNPPTLESLMCSDLENFYTYTGSLTTPPCNEDVIWVDFTTPIEISAKQMNSFRQLHTQEGKPLVHNFRPIQPLNNRIIYKSGYYPAKKEFVSAVPFVDKQAKVYSRGLINLPNSAATPVFGPMIYGIFLMGLLCFFMRK